MRVMPRLDEESTGAEHLGEDDRPRARYERIVGWSIVALATWIAFCVLDANHDWGIHIEFAHGSFAWIPIGWLPNGIHFNHFKFGDVFLNTTANGGDMGAHVWWPWFLEHNWFPKGRLSGWAPDWYAGFPVGQYYFPLPSVAVAVLDHIPFVPYNVAFKLVTIAGPLMLPAGAYSFARGLRAPWPAPPAFAVAGVGMLMETRSDWQIYGGNIASTLAGEFSFTIGLAFALFGLGALAYTLDTGKRRWLPAALIAAAIMSHIVVAIFIAVAATLLWLTRRPRRTWPLAVAIGGVAVTIPMIWLLPLLGNQAYTQSMRYTKVVPKGSFTVWSWLPLPGAVRHTVNDFVRALGTVADPNHAGKHLMQPLWLPWWIWLFAGIAIVAAGWYRRRSTLVLLVLALVLGVMFVEWPEHAIWNTRFLPFWLLTWGLLAAMGAAELLRLAAMTVQWAFGWIRDGDLQDARARAWAELATNESEDVDADARKDAAWALAERRFDADPPGWEPPERLSPENIKRRSQLIGAIGMTVLVASSGAIALNRAWDARNGNSAIAIAGWAAWNYSGYENKEAYPQYHAIMTGMDDVAHQYGNGRALWEPSSGDPDAINSYGTSLALELLPYFTKGRIDSMEGIYFESSATTSYHFLTVSECSKHPSNPVRGLKYGDVDEDFDLCVRHLQMLGVRYLMLWTPEAEAQAEKSADLTLVKDIPGEVRGTSLKGWKVYQVANSDLVVGMDTEPLVAKVHGGSYDKCWGQPYPDKTTPTPELGPWECAVAPWWTNRAILDTPFVQSGPKSWQHVDAKDLASVQPRAVDPVSVSNVKSDVDSISFDVSEIGKPVEVKESYFPNWKVSGAKGPYRLSPNLMVVVPTKHHVKLSYGLTRVDWLGRFVTLGGLVGLGLLAIWHNGERFGAEAPEPDSQDDTDGEAAALDGAGDGDGPTGEDEDTDDDTNDDDDDGGGPDPGGGGGDAPPNRRDPEPALP